MLGDLDENKTELQDPRPASSVTASVPAPSGPIAGPVPAPITPPTPIALPTPSTPPPLPGDGARPRRENTRLPARYRDNGALPWRPKPRKHVDALPEPLIPTTSSLDQSVSVASSPVTAFVGDNSEVQQQRVDVVPAQTKRNVFGLYRQYRSETFPQHDPEAAIDRCLLLEPVNDSPADLPFKATPASALAPCELSEPPLGHSRPTATTNDGSTAECSLSIFHPYPNWTSFRLGQWYWTGSPKNSESTFKDLLDIVTDPRFCAEDLAGVNWKTINEKLVMGETYSSALESSDTLPDDWHETDIQISVPVHSRGETPGVHLYEAATLCHRKITSVIRSRVTDPSIFPHLHLEPYELFWKANSAEPVRVHGEIYTSPAFIEAHDELQRSPQEPGCTRERVVVALMFSSDGTHLTEYGDAKLHPLYMEFGNESKARRSKQSSGCFEHIAYFESLPDAFKDFVKEKFGKSSFTGAFAAHCHRELFHAQWEVLLDEEFVEAYKHGIVILCPDGVERRFYPRVFSYSADYPEK
uniref:Arf family GTPase n=1 Tax=Ganoderma boninense TaxID=34458 RepID=A0A5K1K7G7_9APHY|nr:Arf family GTPase [Ganoderma boninense]